MKFLCDRCKTRYSIGDDRVRGKILKIRCKNCANVITVREGMTDSEPAIASSANEAATVPSPAAERRDKKTTLAPAAQVATPAVTPPAPLKPPAALEEEWYVSIDGEQAGPYSLHEAQRWVGAKPANADLHCWSEGFDDWLPVDKVSHFRGLRKPPPAAVRAPPPVSRAPVQPIAHVEEEPKPLFAATMASLEKGAALAAAERARVQPVAVKSNGTAPHGAIAHAPMAKAGTGPEPALGYVAPKTNGATLPAPKPAAISVKPASGRVGTVPGFGVPAEPDAATQLEGRPYEEEATKRADPPPPVSLKDLRPPIVAEVPRPPIVAEAKPDDDYDGDDGFDIGEVSRVVKLADIARMPKKERTAPVRRAASMGAGVGRSQVSGAAINVPTNGTGALGAVGTSPFGDPALAAEPLPELAPLAPPPPQTNRLYIVLLAVSLLLLGAVGVVVYVVTQNDDDPTSTDLVKTNDYDTTRPDDPMHHGGVPVENGGSATSGPFVPHPPPRYRPPLPHEGSGSAGSNHDEPPTSGALKGDEVEAEAARHSSGTQRCYMRSQKGEQAIIVGDVKKISVQLEIDKDGAVTSVKLSDHGGDSLGVCLINQVKGWRFRETPTGGRFQITMVFQGA